MRPLHSAAIVAAVLGVAMLTVGARLPAVCALALAGLLVLGAAMLPRFTIPGPGAPSHDDPEAPAPHGEDGFDPGGSGPAPDDHRAIPHLPAVPSGRVVDAWAPSTHRVRVISAPERASILARSGAAPAQRAVLVSDTASPHHPYAVAVYVADRHVGHLGGDAVLDYGPRLAELSAAGIDVRTEALLMPGAVDITLPDPGGLVPVNRIPHGVVLPHGARMTVRTAPVPDHDRGNADEDPRHATGDHPTSEAERLLRHYDRAGEDVWLAVTLVASRPPHRRDPVREIDVVLDGVAVGRLAHHDVEEIVPLLAYLGDHQIRPVAAAVLHHGAGGRHLAVSCIRARDADESWLRGLRDPER